MKIIGNKINNAPFTIPGRRFAEEDNSIYVELSNIITPFEAIADVKEHQVIASIKGIAWMNRYSIVGGTADSIVITSGVDIVNNEVPLKDGMQFTFISTATNTLATGMTASVNGNPSKPIHLDGANVPIGWIMPNAEYTLQYNQTQDVYDIIVTGAMRWITTQQQHAQLHGDPTIIFQAEDPILDKDVVNLRTLNNAISNLVAAPGSVEYTVPGDYLFTVPNSVRLIQVYGIAGGGGGTSNTYTTGGTSSVTGWNIRPFQGHINDWETRYVGDAGSSCANILGSSQANTYFVDVNGVQHAFTILSGSVGAVEGITSAVVNGITVRRNIAQPTTGPICGLEAAALGYTVQYNRKHWKIEVYETITTNTTVTHNDWFGGAAGTIMVNIPYTVSPGDVIALTIGAGGIHGVAGTATKFKGVVYAGGAAGARTSLVAATNSTPMGVFTSYAAIGDARGGEAGLGNGGLAAGTPINAQGYGSGGGGFNPVDLTNVTVTDAANGRDGYINISWG